MLLLSLLLIELLVPLLLQLMMQILGATGCEYCGFEAKIPRSYWWAVSPSRKGEEQGLQQILLYMTHQVDYVRTGLQEMGIVAIIKKPGWEHSKHLICTYIMQSLEHFSFKLILKSSLDLTAYALIKTFFNLLL